MSTACTISKNLLKMTPVISEASTPPPELETVSVVVESKAPAMRIFFRFVFDLVPDFRFGSGI
ncbi:MAG: hypothetical protein WCW30_01180 [Candidatus Gracilibacteria bacterium]